MTGGTWGRSGRAWVVEAVLPLLPAFYHESRGKTTAAQNPPQGPEKPQAATGKTQDEEMGGRANVGLAPSERTPDETARRAQGLEAKAAGFPKTRRPLALRRGLVLH